MKKKKPKQPAKPGWLPRIIFSVVIVLSVVLLARQLLSAQKKTDTKATPAAATEAPAGVRVIATTSTIVDRGVAISFSAKPIAGQSDLTEINLAFTNPTSGQPIVLESPPSVWIGSQTSRIVDAQGKQALTCEDKIKLYLQSTLDFRAEIDLNSYFVLTLNNDPSISVIDPLGGVTGISQLYAMVNLKSRGEDWVMTRDGKKLFVTLPDANQVAVVDAENFTVLQYLDVGKNPVRIALQPDGRYVWVGNDTNGLGSAGITVLDVEKLTVAANIPTGTGSHEITFSGQVANLHPHGGSDVTPNPEAKTNYAFISNQQGTVSVVDTNTLDFVSSIDVGRELTSLGFSSVSNAVYVAAKGDNGLTVIDASTHEITGRVEDLASGIETIRFSPDGRWGFAISRTANTVDVIDAATNRRVRSLTVEGGPDKVSFTTGYAYIHATQKPEVALIDLNQINQAEALSAVNVIGGQMPPDQADANLSVADAIVPVHEHGGHVLIANPGDQSIYYYMEGMNAPMGSFQTYGRTPRAVRIVDRSIQETAPGVYSATIKIPHTGKYEAAFLLDSPRIIQCFPFSTVQETALAGNNEQANPKPALKFLTTEREVKAGEHLLFKFAIHDSQTNVPISDLNDVYLLATMVSGQRSDRFKSNSIGQGVYEVDLSFVEPGVYKIFFTIPSLKVKVDDLPFLTMHVSPTQ